MNYLLRRERRRLARDLINQRIIEQVIDIERQREDDLRREFHSIIHDMQDLERRKQSRSHSQNSRHRDTERYRQDDVDVYDEQQRCRSGSLTHHSRHHYHHRHRRTESIECSLVTLTYRNACANKHGDEIMVVQNARTVFKGCLADGDQLTFKSKRYKDDPRIKLEFFINDIIEDQTTTCCEHSLIRKCNLECFVIESVSGSKPCTRCQLEKATSSSSSSPSPPMIRSNRSSTITNNEQKQTPTAIRQKSFAQTTQHTQKLKPPVSLNNRVRKIENKRVPTVIQSIEEPNNADSDRKRIQTSSMPESDVERTPSQGFSSDMLEFPESKLLLSDEAEHQQQRHHTEESSTNFSALVSSTDRESPPPLPQPPSKVYGPPQLSTMLSISDAHDSPFDNLLDTAEDTADHSTSKTSESLNIQQKKDSHSDADNENSQQETQQSNRFFQFLRSMSSNVETNQSEPRTPQTSTISVNTTRHFSMDGDATQVLLTRLGIIRQQPTESTETSIGNAPRERGNVEYFMLAYLNPMRPNNSTIVQLRGLVNFLKIFDDVDDCVAFINSITNERVILITSETFSNLILSRIEDLQQIFTIYILCDNDSNQEKSPTKISKVKGFYSNIDNIRQQMSTDINEVTRDLIAYMNISANATTPDPMFVYSQLMSEIILDSDETELALKELISFARHEYDGNEEELVIIEEFESDYHKERAIWWFTRQCFLSKMINKALRIPEADILFRLRLFIQHLYHQIEDESISNTSLTVYLGQTINQNDLDDLQKSVTNHGLLVFSQFLCGATDLSRAIQIAKRLPSLSDDYVPVVLHLNIPSNLQCANTSSLRSFIDDDNDVILNMGIMGRLTKIDKVHCDTGAAAIHLTLVKCESERAIQRMLDTKRSEVKGAAPLVSLIKLMMLMNQQARAEQLVQMIFNDETLKSDPNLQGSIAAACHILGAGCHARGDFRRAAELFHLSLDTFLRFVPSDAVQLSPTYNNIGSMYFRQEEYEKAIDYHQKALDVQLHSHNPSLSAIASYSNNIGVVHLKQGKYGDAAKAFDRALKILQQLNDGNDSDLASTYDNLGDAYLLQDQYDDALTYYSKALEIQRNIEPRNLQALASYNNSIGNVYNKKHQYGDALVHFKRALEYQKEYLPATHPSFASLYNNIGSMFYRQEQYTDALPYYLKSLEIELMCLPENHPTIAVTHFNIATTYTGLGRFEEAIASTERSIQQLLKTLPPDHPEVIENRSYIETIKRKQMLKGLFDSNTASF